MRKPKHAQIYEQLRAAIESGEHAVGDRLPSEHELVRQTGASRPTVARALRELQTDGLIDRRVGSGTFVRQQTVGSRAGMMFGLLIPELGNTEIFEPICAAMARHLQQHRHTLLWGDAGGTEPDAPRARAEHACTDFISRGVSGVFFAPMELMPEVDRINRDIVDRLTAARIPVVLLDRDFVPHPERSDCDMVGIDNHRGGYLLAEHLVKQGCQRIAFLAQPHSAPTVDRRVAGYREALWRAGIEPKSRFMLEGDPDDAEFVTGFMRRLKPDAVVCANDLTAAHLLHTLDACEVSVPETVRVVGFDDVRFARVVRVPLTTVHQPCDGIAAVASATMLERVGEPSLPARRIVVAPKLVVRKSCGSGQPSPPE